MKKKTFTSLLFATVLATLAWGLSGCQTTEGFGKDVQHLGENIHDSAERHE